MKNKHRRLEQDAKISKNRTNIDFARIRDGVCNMVKNTVYCNIK